MSSARPSPLSPKPTDPVYASTCDVPATSQSRKLPRVGLARREVAERQQVGLGLEREHGDVEVVADHGRRRDAGARAEVADERRRADAPRLWTRNPS